ncbi:MAG: 16S rRNA (adenine(1518)-N(6)/adenine(1519)-N(6))-dimethyltransferase RsmA [Gammaproteobacteria bacterium]|nr:16S rRNA (adenine(1518)-N(6)/adenine(1519)-N(6))-dimethyltransferase RsmA [Gammaproteobacteria bacterium]
MFLHPRKRFGQNFLTDQQIIKKIILAIQPRSNDNIVEIGPGQGALTYPLLEHVESLNVVEIDRDLCAVLSKIEKLTIHCQDVLKFDFAAAFENHSVRIVGNLPYNISTPLLFHLFEYSDQIIDMHLMLQKEVVDRLTAMPNCKNYGRLSVMAQYYAEVYKLFEVNPSSFFPAPKVTSAVICVKPRPHRELEKIQEEDFSRLVKQAFSQRRKTLRNNLKLLLNEENIRACDIDPGARAETLTLQEFILLQRRLISLTKQKA